MMVIFWAITPLQSAIFGLGSITRKRPTQFVTTAALLPLESQVNALNANFLTKAYSVAWLNQTLPSFTTKQHAVVPFVPQHPRSDFLTDETWTTYTQQYKAHLTCTPAIVKSGANLQYGFSNGKGCSVSGMVLPNAKSLNASYMLVYIGWHDNAVLDYSLNNPNCSIEHSNTFLAVWASRASQTTAGVYNNLTALFCDTSYTVQNVSTSVMASDGSIRSGLDLPELGQSGALTRLSPDTFNATNFEYIIGTGITATSQITDWPNSALIEQYPRLFDYGLTWPSTNMIGYAAATLPSLDSAGQLADPMNLQNTFEQVHQLLFSMAIKTLLVPHNMSASGQTRDGIIQDQPEAVVMIRLFSIIIEVLLAVVAVIAGILGYISYKRPSNMCADPASIGNIMELVAHSSSISETFQGASSASATSLEASVAGRRFKLIGSSGSESMRLEAIADREMKDSSCSKNEAFNDPNHIVPPFHPMEMRYWIAISFIVILASSVCGIAVLRYVINKNNGEQKFLTSATPPLICCRT
jgi:hypothetical protein